MKYKPIKLTAFLLSIACGISIFGMSAAKNALADDDLQESLDSTNQLIEELREKQSEISSELSSLNSDVDEASKKIDSLTSDINSKQNQINELASEIAELEKEKEEMYEAMKLRIQYSYENQSGSIYDAIFSSNDFDDFLNRAMYIQNIVNYDKEQLEKLNNIINEVADKQATVTNELAALDMLKEEATTEANNLQTMIADKSSELDISEDSLTELLAQAEEYEAKLEEEKEAQAEAERQAYLAAIEAENQRAEAESTDNSSSNSESSSSSSGSSSTTETTTTAYNYTASELDMMAAIIYVEAGVEPYEGKVAVGSVVMNRVESSYFPNTISGVIYQSGQFTPVASGRFELALSNSLATADCISAAQEVLNGRRNVPYLFFHMYTGRTNNYSSYTIIGNHILYNY